jgi:hypothetical protein
MMSQDTLNMALEIGLRENDPRVWLLLGVASGRSTTMLSKVQPTRELFEEMVVAGKAGMSIDDAIARIDRWVEERWNEARDHVQRTTRA